jgi:hypothetical protein
MRRLTGLLIAVAIGATVAPAAADEPSPTAPAPSTPAASTPPAEAPADVEPRMDEGLEQLASKDWKDAAVTFYGVYRSLPDNDLRRDTVSFHLATALARAGYVQAAIEHFLEVLTARRVPELLGKALTELKPLFEQHLVDEGRFVEGVIYGSTFSELPPDVADFVEYLQALTDVRSGFAEWGRGRLEVLSKARRAYSFHARYLLAVEQLARKDDPAAEKEFREIIAAEGAPADIRNQARLALARMLYEKKAYDEAWKAYSRVDFALPLMDVVMLEQAWTHVAGGDQQRALGMLVGLGAPVFKSLFAPERDLIRAMALRRLCQYRAAHVTVRQFRAAYGPLLRKIRDRAPLSEDPAMLTWASNGTRLLAEQTRMRSVLAREQARARSLGDKPLAQHLETIYASGVARADTAVKRDLSRAIDQVSEELLRIDEQMSLISYEIGAGLFKSGGDGASAAAPSTLRPADIPHGSARVYFKFDGEYWSDELGDYTVLSQDRCVR